MHEEQLTLAPIVVDSIIESKELTYFSDGAVIALKGSNITDLLVSLDGGINGAKEL